ncbi:MAG: ABC transporter permease [Chloroflexi bacterium]|nr:ABC transporter permease [Chloroflexota bacterium]MXZ03288.1 ABC transporter permease [Chloroflexota bacterium]MYK62256.1 ABC transporter permease [Chloroflexota bacterium]
MFRFLAGRILTSLISVFGATLAIFILVHVNPKDPREIFVPQSGYGLTQESWNRLGDRLGFDKPAPVQYVEWLGRVFRLDFGVSLGLQIDVWDIIKGRLGATVQLGIGGWLIAVLMGIPTGVVAAVWRGGIFDYLARFVALVGQAAPAFVTGIVMIWLFSVNLNAISDDSPFAFLRIFAMPAGGRTPDELRWKEYVLPCLALGWGSAAGLMRLTRSSMLEILDSEFVKMARAKGVGNTTVIFKHALRNALIAPITSMLLLFAGFLNGALVVEIVFSWPGIGQVALQEAVQNNDFPLLLGTVIIFLMYFLVFATLADILYTVIDPRVRLR